MSGSRGFCAGLCLLAVLSACAREPGPPPGPPEKVTVAYPPVPLVSLFFVAKEKGFFAAEGLEVVPERHEFGRLALQSVLDGKADVATSADTPVMLAVAAGQPVAVLAEIGTSTRATGIVARKDRGIAGPMDLGGKRIGLTRGTTAEFFVDSFLQTRGIGSEEVVLVDLRPAEIVGALASGEVDAAAVWQESIEQALAALGGKGVTFFDETVYSDRFCVAAAPSFVKGRPGAARRLLRALLRAESFARENKGESVQLVARSISRDPAMLDRIWGAFDFRVRLDQALLVSLEDQTRWAVRAGLARGDSRPNYLEVIRPEVLRSVHPDAVGIIP